MKLTQDQFRQLQKLWYNKLSDHGFHDIEEFKNNELVLKQSETNNRWKSNNDLFSIADAEEYFRFLRHSVNDPDTTFKNDFDRHILMLYSEGIKSKEILQSLKLLGNPYSRKAIYLIIRRYVLTWRMKHT